MIHIEYYLYSCRGQFYSFFFNISHTNIIIVILHKIFLISISTYTYYAYNHKFSFQFVFTANMLQIFLKLFLYVSKCASFRIATTPWTYSVCAARNGTCHCHRTKVAHPVSGFVCRCAGTFFDRTLDFLLGRQTKSIWNCIWHMHLAQLRGIVFFKIEMLIKLHNTIIFVFISVLLCALASSNNWLNVVLLSEALSMIRLLLVPFWCQLWNF